MIRDYEEFAAVAITKRSFLAIKNGNRSLKHFPSDSFVKKAKKLIDFEGRVIRRFKPGYEMNVEWYVDGKPVVMRMQTNWVEPLDGNWKEIK